MFRKDTNIELFIEWTKGNDLLGGVELRDLNGYGRGLVATVCFGLYLLLSPVLYYAFSAV